MMLSSNQAKLVGAGKEKQKAKCLRGWRKEGDVGLKSVCVHTVYHYLESSIIQNDSDLEFPDRSGIEDPAPYRFPL